MPGLDDERLRTLLRRPAVPADLAARLRANLAEQRRQARRRLRARALAAALAGALAAGLWLALPAQRQPAPLVEAALRHLEEERSLEGVRTGPPLRWLARAGLTLPPGAHLLLTKNCVVAGVLVRHLRLVLADGTVTEVLVETGGRWQGRLPSRGRTGGRAWRVAARGAVTVLAFGPPEASEALAGLGRALLHGPARPRHPNDSQPHLEEA